MDMECNERLPSNQVAVTCQYEKRCVGSRVNGSRFCSKHVLPGNSHQCTHIRNGTQCKNKISATENRTLCSTHLAVKASRKRRRTEAPAHKDQLNKTPPLALHVFRIMTQDRQRLNIKPNMYKRPLEHLKWVVKQQDLEEKPIYPSGLEADCSKHQSPHETMSLDNEIPLNSESMGDETCRGVYLSRLEERLHRKVDSLIHQVNCHRRTSVRLPACTKAVTAAARANVQKTTALLLGKTRAVPEEEVSIEEHCACSLPNRATKYCCSVCSGRALPFTKYCIKHILHDPSQLLYSSCRASPCPAPAIKDRSCRVHSILERYGATESTQIETEPSSSESEGEESSTAPLEANINSWPPSPWLRRKIDPSIPVPPPPSENHQTPLAPELDMLAVQPDNILDTESLPEEPDIPIAVRFLEPSPQPTVKRRKEEEMQARFLQMMKCAPPGYYYPHHPFPYPVYVQGYTKEGEPAMYPPHQPPPQGGVKQEPRFQPPQHGKNGSRPDTPVISSSIAAPPEQLQEPDNHQQQGSPASSSTMALLKSKLADGGVKREDQGTPPKQKQEPPPPSHPGQQYPPIAMQYPQQYYLQMYVPPPSPMVAPQPAMLAASEPSPAVTPASTSNGPTKKQESEAITPEQDFQRQAILQQQRQRQRILAADHLQAQQAGQHQQQYYQFYKPFPPTTPPTPTTPVKADPPKKKKKSKSKKPSLSSPGATKDQLSSVQSLMTTASSGRLPPDTALVDGEPPSRTHKRVKKEVQQHPANTYGAPPHPAFYHVPNHQLVMAPSMKPAHYVNGTAGSGGGVFIQRADDGKEMLVSEAVLSRSRPSTILMQNREWVERYMKKGGPGGSDPTPSSHHNNNNNNRKNSSPQKKSPSKTPRNLIFHNTEVTMISDKLAKQQRNAEEKHKANCTKVGKQTPVVSSAPPKQPPPPSSAAPTTNTADSKKPAEGIT